MTSYWDAYSSGVWGSSENTLVFIMEDMMLLEEVSELMPSEDREESGFTCRMPPSGPCR